MAQTAAEITQEIDALKTRLAASATELDDRLAHAPRAARFALRHRRAIVGILTMLLAGLAINGARRSSGGGDCDNGCCCCARRSR